MDNEDISGRLELGLSRIGLRSTRQRELVYEILLSTHDHPTAEDVFARARQRVSTISLATVYNCLDTLTSAGIVRAVHRDRESTRYCANSCEHAHFHDLSDGKVSDVPLSPEALQYLRSLAPQGYVVERIELNYVGRHDESSGYILK